MFSANMALAFEQFPRSLAWELISQSGNAELDSNGDPYSLYYAQPGETKSMSVTVRNMSSNPRAEMWYGVSDLLPEGPNYPNAHAIGLGTWAPIDNIPSFLDPSSFIINDNRFAYYDGEPINKGQSMTLNFQVKIKDNIAPGTYDLVISLVREFDEWGYRTDSAGNNHKYRSVLYRFIVGNREVGLQEVGKYYVDNVDVDGGKTMYFCDTSGGCGQPMPVAMAHEMNMTLRWQAGIQDEDDNSGEQVGSNAAMVNPLSRFEMLFTTIEHGVPDAYSSITTRIYGYNIQTQALRNLYTYIGDYTLLLVLGTTSNELILFPLSLESSPDPCFSPWLNNEKHYALNLESPSQPLADWITPDWKVRIEQDKLQGSCKL